MLTLATLTEVVKAHALNPTMSNEEALNSLLGPYIRAGRIKNRNGDELYLDKQRTSRILNGKEDVPHALRQSIGRMGIEGDTAENFSESIGELVDSYEMQALTDTVIALIDEDDPRRSALEKMSGNPPVFLAHALLLAIRADNRQDDSTILWSFGTGSLSIRQGDLLGFGFGNRNRTRPIVAIPVDTTFETHLASASSHRTKVVSPQSIHGQWLRRMSEAGVRRQDMERRIRQNLTRKTGGADSRGRYPLGTIVEVVTKRAVYYLVALSDLDEEGKAACSREQVISVLGNLASYYDRRGQAAPLYLPLMGTGLSRANLSAEESLEFTKNAFVAGDFPPKGPITIVVPEETAEILSGAIGEPIQH